MMTLPDTGGQLVTEARDRVPLPLAAGILVVGFTLNAVL